MLAVLTFVGVISPVTLLLFTFLLNIGSAMNNPAWQAIVPELVPREQIPNAVTLNAASNNIARALGPALGGVDDRGVCGAASGSGVGVCIELGFVCGRDLDPVAMETAADLPECVAGGADRGVWYGRDCGTCGMRRTCRGR